jgi:putative oxidoreductase
MNPGLPLLHWARAAGALIAERLSWLPPLLARVALGVVFVGSGWGKLHHLDKVSAYFADLGIPAPGFNALLAASAELVCGALLLVGLLTRLAAVPLIVTMAVAIVTAKRDDIHRLADLLGMQEFLFIVLCVWLGVAGGGALSLDGLWRGRSRAAQKAAVDPVATPRQEGAQSA